jgi:hypothetical protein
MAVRCPKCGREYDVTLFAYGRDVACPCGETISLESGHLIAGDFDIDALEREIFEAVDERERRFDRSRADRIRRQANRIASLILYSDMPRLDIEIEIRSFREAVLGELPEKGALFDAVYLARFQRLWTQFRAAEDELFGGMKQLD